MIRYTHHDSPTGKLLLAASPQGLCVLEFPGSRHACQRDERWISGSDPILSQARRQLDAYFTGRLQAFDLPLAPQGTPFQVLVWQALARIPYGRTISYAELARQVGRPAAVRAVGGANGRNPLAIVLPCHRVIGSDGSLTGFDAGLPIKRFLLGLEGALPGSLPLPGLDLHTA